MSSASRPPEPSADSAAPARATRRRGEAFTRALHEAVLEELALTSFEELAFDKIAARAGTGKSALYRRWSTPKELLLDALSDPVTGFGTPVDPDTGSLHGDLTELLGSFARVLDEPRGQALRPLMTKRPRHPELFDEVLRLIVLPHERVLLDILGRAVDRGEADPRRVTRRVASVGPRMIVAESMQKGTVDAAEVEAIINEVLLPLAASRG
ncbi:TetR/AcrR family transcriptional regulator [Streptomyces sp. GZWMJZ-114]|uniref:TetR/AcrR family transcriptional regulator n=1 Tax=Streptomyces sp. GZWMJZ-114 TaxID=2494734 RepID=UPI001013026C|nr:TetR/AcrR family transcriptional regulator [Streptomyces sp. GZWMJZ-114]